MKIGSPEHFDHYFQVIFPGTSELLEQVFRLRAQVYCYEFHYEREEDCPGGMEQDDYDRQSVHCLLMHRTSGRPAGCVRLVKTTSDDSVDLLPFERFCGSSLSHETLHPDRLPRADLCEISRLAVPADFRKRQGEPESRFGNLEGLDLELTEHELRTYPLLSVVLFLAATSLVVLTRRRHVFAMMEPRLARLLYRSGLKFTQIGELVDYHGPRAAFYIPIEQALTGMKDDLRQLYDFVHRKISSEVAQANLDFANTAAVNPFPSP